MAVSRLDEQNEEEDDELIADEPAFFPTARHMHVCQLAYGGVRHKLTAI